MMSAKEPRVAVLMGGKSAEHEVSLASGRRVLEALAPRSPLPVVLERDGRWIIGGEAQPSLGRALDRLLERADLAFLALHGTFGEDGTIQGLLEMAGLPYTGSGVMASALCMDKPRTKAVYRDAGLPTPRGVSVAQEDSPERRRGSLAEAAALGFPLVVKPACLGSSVGISFPADAAALERAVADLVASSGRVLVEECVRGTELTCGVLSIDREGRRFALPVTEIVPGASFGFFDYTAKYTPGATEEITPARIPPEVARQVQAAALAAHEALGCRDFSRTDFMLGPSGRLVLLETNTIPGLTQTSLLPQGAAAVGLDYAALIGVMVDNAWRRRETARS